MHHRFERVVIGALKSLMGDVNFIKRELLFMATQTEQLSEAVGVLVDNVGKLSEAAATHDTAVQAELAALSAAIANSPAKDDPAVAAAIDAVKTSSASVANLSAQIQGETDALAASIAAPAPAPAPDPAPPTT